MGAGVLGFLRGCGMEARGRRLLARIVGFLQDLVVIAEFPDY